MKYKYLFILILLLPMMTIQAQDLNKTMMDSRFNKEILIGYCDRIGLEQGDFGDLFKLEYKDYQPDEKVINKLKKLEQNFSVVLLMASWCPDCQDLVPQFYKILDQAEISDKKVKVISVDGYKKCEGIDLKKYEMEKVPTFIFYRHEKEIGRIIEHPEERLEEDINKILIGG